MISACIRPVTFSFLKTVIKDYQEYESIYKNTEKYFLSESNHLSRTYN